MSNRKRHCFGIRHAMQQRRKKRNDSRRTRAYLSIWKKSPFSMHSFVAFYLWLPTDTIVLRGKFFDCKQNDSVRSTRLQPWFLFCFENKRKKSVFSGATDTETSHWNTSTSKLNWNTCIVQISCYQIIQQTKEEKKEAKDHC